MTTYLPLTVDARNVIISKSIDGEGMTAEVEMMNGKRSGVQNLFLEYT